MNGFDLYREIKKVYARVKACFLTALIDLQEYGEGYSIVKPID